MIQVLGFIVSSTVLFGGIVQVVIGVVGLLFGGGLRIARVR